MPGQEKPLRYSARVVLGWGWRQVTVWDSEMKVTQSLGTDSS